MRVIGGSAERYFDHEEFERWFGQAEYTLQSAKRDLTASDYSWCCFKAQQAAEYALKGLLRGLGIAGFGHSTLKLVEELTKAGVEASAELSRWARELDRHYIPPRYSESVVRFVKEQGGHAKSS